jgi:LysM repeat protein
VQTIKTAIVVFLLLVVFYGVYEVLNRPPEEPPEEVAWLDDEVVSPPDIQFGTEMDGDMGDPLVSLPPETEMTGESGIPQLPAGFPGAPGPSNIAERGTGDLSLPDDAHAATAETRYGDAPRFGDTREVVPPPDTYQNSVPDSVPAAAAPPPAIAANRSGPAAEPTMPSSSPSAESTATSGSADGGQIQHNQFYNEPIVVTPNGSSDPPAAVGAQAFRRAMRLANDLIEQGKYHDALFELSVFYQSPDLSPDEHQELLNLLDPLAGRVIYSREHLILPPYRVRRNETLMDIAAQYNVPWQLLQKINGIEKPRVLLPTSEVKVVPGPFRADVDLQTRQLTLFLGQLYAGRFPVALGPDSQLQVGEFQIRDKRENRDFFAADGKMIPASSPDNPFGDAWLDLGGDLSIHGSPMGGLGQTRGCISLSPRDADDVYGILSVGSRVRIVR